MIIKIADLEVKTRPTLERWKTLGHLRSINPNIDLPLASQSQSCELFSFLFFFRLKTYVKSGAISCWTDEDQLQIWGSHSSSTNNHLHYLLLVNDWNVNIFSVYHSRRVNVATWVLVLPIDIANSYRLSRVRYIYSERDICRVFGITF